MSVGCGEMEDGYLFVSIFAFQRLHHKGWGQSVKLGPHSAIWGKLGTGVQGIYL